MCQVQLEEGESQDVIVCPPLQDILYQGPLQSLLPSRSQRPLILGTHNELCEQGTHNELCEQGPLVWENQDDGRWHLQDNKPWSKWMLSMKSRSLA